MIFFKCEEKIVAILLVFGMVQVSLQDDSFWSSETFLKNLNDARGDESFGYDYYQNVNGLMAQSNKVPESVVIN